MLKLPIPYSTLIGRPEGSMYMFGGGGLAHVMSVVGGVMQMV